MSGRTAEGNLAIGALSLGAGIFITMVSDGSVIAYGAMIIGAIEIVVGLAQLGGRAATPASTDDDIVGAVPRAAADGPQWQCPQCGDLNAGGDECGHCGQQRRRASR